MNVETLIEAVLGGADPREVVRASIEEGISITSSEDNPRDHFRMTYSSYTDLLEKYAPKWSKKYDGPSCHKALSGIQDAAPVIPKRAKELAAELAKNINKANAAWAKEIKLLIKVLKNKQPYQY